MSLNRNSLVGETGVVVHSDNIVFWDDEGPGPGRVSIKMGFLFSGLYSKFEPFSLRFYLHFGVFSDI